jgi:hypothetical protein
MTQHTPTYHLDRTLPLGRDLDWLPGPIKARRWWTTSATWAATAGLATAVTVASLGALAPIAAVAAVGGFLAGDRAGRARMRRGLERLARGRLDLLRLGASAEDDLVHVTGRVTAVTTLTSVLHGVPGVYRRMTFRHGWRRYLHEAAMDFDLVGGDGERIRVHVSGAHLLAPASRDLAEYPTAVLASRALSPALQSLWGDDGRGLTRRDQPVPAAEVVLGAGAMVEIIGHKTRTIDPTAQSPNREPPMRTALRSGQIPLIIAPVNPITE